ncbi:MAG TPA: hypothetical protein PKE04_15435 [Clostridia bacterium]|nr:hypothetical protein [Clostridia bacterium]
MSIKRTGILKLACWTLALLLAVAPLASRASALTVYYAKDNRIYREALARDTTLETTAFANAATLDAAWTTAYLSGQEPDVLLLDEKSELPIWRLVQVQAFYDLTDLWQEDPYYNPNDYFANVMTAGSLDGRQYFLPFCFQLTHAFTTQERMDLYDMKFDARETSMQDALDLLWRHLEDMMGEQDMAALVWSITRSDAPMQMMEFCGLPVVDYGQSEIVVDKNALFEISTMIRNVYENSAQLERVVRKYYNNVIGVLEHVSLMIEDAPWPFNLRLYNSGYGSGLWEEPVSFVFPDWTKPGIYHAQITHYGAVSANASDPQAGYELLRALQDEDISDTVFNKGMADSVYEMSVSREVMDRTLDNLENQEGGYMMLGGKRTVVDWYEEQIETVLNSIADAVLPDRAVGAILMDCLEPYYGMQDDFDACYDELLDRLTLFLEEAPLVEAER